MTFRTVVFSALLGATTLIACSKDAPTGSGTRLSRARLNGEYTCVEFQGYFAGPQGPGVYEGSCGAYVAATNPSRRDSIELAPFAINENNSVSRQEFPSAVVSYDSTSAKLTISGAEMETEEYDAIVQGGVVYLVRHFAPFDFSGDGLVDELLLVYRRR